MEANKAEHPTGTSTHVDWETVHAEVLERCAWAKMCAPGLWDLFISKLEAKTFSLDEVTREGKRLKNLYGSVADHRAVFMDAVAEWFDAEIRR